MLDLSEFEFPVFEKKYLIKEHLLDSYGHMNNASYIQLFEEARWDLVTERGYGLNTVQKMMQGPIILSLKTDFLKEIGPREEITITTRVSDYRGKTGTIHQEMIKSNGKVACKADFVFGLFDLKQRKLIMPTEEWVLAVSDKKK